MQSDDDKKAGVLLETAKSKSNSHLDKALGPILDLGGTCLSLNAMSKSFSISASVPPAVADGADVVVGVNLIRFPDPLVFFQVRWGPCLYQKGLHLGLHIHQNDVN